MSFGQPGPRVSVEPAYPPQNERYTLLWRLRSASRLSWQPSCSTRKFIQPPATMGKSFQTRVSVVLLASFTLAAIVFACINLSLEAKEQTPVDGVTWFEADGGLQAHRVLQGGPGQRAGIEAGDV